MSDKVEGYKGFNKHLSCRGYQFEEGKTFKHDGDISICNSGFHFCENPIDIFSYYSPDDSVFHIVSGHGKTLKHDEDSKIVCSEITIGASISLHDFIADGIKFFFNRKYSSNNTRHSTGDSSASSATGYSSASSATGDSSASSATGYRSASSATGYRSASSATGDSSASSATGDSSASSATGDSSASSATGNSSASSATGNSSASSATGYRSASSATGNRSAAVCTGLYGKAMAGRYGCIALAFYNENEQRIEMRCAETGCGDGLDGKLKAMAWYKLDDDGNFIEC